MINLITSAKNTHSKSIRHYLTGLFLFFTLLFSATTFAQTVGTSKLVCTNAKSCTSKDLAIVGIAIDAPPCTSCTPGQTVTYPLKMTIHNGTKSERTSFALYGSLSGGATINGVSGNIFVCVGPITVKSDQLLPGESAPGNQTFAVGTITFTCGQDLTLSNNFLAWTDASGNTTDRCTTFSNATTCADIAPKCGTAASITIKGPVVPPTLFQVDPTCTVSTGTITVTSTTTGFTFSLDGGSFTAYPTGGWTVSPGSHNVRSKNADGCISPQANVTIANAPAPPLQPTVTITEPRLCGPATATCTVTCPTGAGYLYSNNGGAYQASPVFSGLAAGAGFSITVKNSAGCVSAATDCSNYTSVSCTNPVSTQKAVSDLPVISEATTVTAAPNPFNDHIRFTITPAASGRGTLDLYNTLGQKVKTVFQGQVQKGQTQTIEYSVPFSQRNMLIYQFSVGKERLSGKLLGLR